MSDAFNPLPITGPQYQTSHDGVQLVKEIVKHYTRVRHETLKRGLTHDLPQRLKHVTANVTLIYERFLRGHHVHHESEEGYIKELGEWLIQKHAVVTGTKAGEWDFRPAEHMRKKQTIIT